MNKKQLIKIILSVLIAALTTLELRLRTTRNYIAQWCLRLALRLPKKLKFFGGPIVMALAIITIFAAFGLSSCNVVRTITNRSEFFQKGDTSVTIQTKTIESYDASRK